MSFFVLQVEILLKDLEGFSTGNLIQLMFKDSPTSSTLAEAAFQFNICDI